MSGARESATDTSEHGLASPRPRLSLSLTGDLLAMVEEIAAARQIPPGEVVRRAITHEHYFFTKEAEGMVLKGHWPNGDVDRIAFVR